MLIHDDRGRGLAGHKAIVLMQSARLATHGAAVIVTRAHLEPVRFGRTLGEGFDHKATQNYVPGSAG